jgi:dihydroxyacetone kinase-like protein
MELYILYAAVVPLLAKKGIRVYRPYVGNYFTSLEMMGVTLTLMKVDAELKQLVDLEVDCMGLTQFGPSAPGG